MPFWGVLQTLVIGLYTQEPTILILRMKRTKNKPNMAIFDTLWLLRAANGSVWGTLGPLASSLVKFLLSWGRLKRSARAVQLFGRLAVLETHTLRY